MDPSFFTRFGLYVQPEFLDAETCERVRAAVRSAASVAATVEDEGRQEVDPDQRKTKLARVDDETIALVRDRLEALRGRLEEHFGVSLESCQKPQFLVYGEGDFFGPHKDNSDKEHAADFAKARQVSTVIFLNDSSPEPRPGSYGGGALTFYGFFQDDPKGKGVGLPLVGASGTLVAFPSDRVHGVTPVTHGERYTVTTWFV